MCHLVYIILPICQSASVGTLMAITADRFRAIVFPVKSPLTRKTAFCILAAILDRFSDHCIAWFSSLLRFHITWCCVQCGRLAIRMSGAHWMSTRYPILLSALSILSGITAYSFRKSAHPVAMENKRRYIPMRIEEYFVRSCNVILYRTL